MYQKKRRRNRLKRIRENWDLYLLIFPVILYFIIFKYVPMYGVQIAFKDFISVEGILDSPWVGIEHFTRFFESFYFERFLKLFLQFPISINNEFNINREEGSYGETYCKKKAEEIVFIYLYSCHRAI
jgi:putative aldouronate transport system permease protein